MSATELKEGHCLSKSIFGFYGCFFGLIALSLGSDFAYATTPSELALTGASDVSAGFCSTVFTVTAENSGGNPSAVSSNTTVTLSGGGSGTFYTDSACTTSATSIVIASGATSQNFYFKDSKPQSLTLSVAATGLTGDGLPVTVVANDMSKLALTLPASFTDGSCSGAITVTSEDPSGNPVPVSSGTTVSLTSGGSGHLYSDSTCSDPITTLILGPEDSAEKFYFKDSKPEVLTLTVSATGFSSAAATITVGGAKPSKLSLSGPFFVADGSCSGAITVTSQDSGGISRPWPQTRR